MMFWRLTIEYRAKRARTFYWRESADDIGRRVAVVFTDGPRVVVDAPRFDPRPKRVIVEPISEAQYVKATRPGE